MYDSVMSIEELKNQLAELKILIIKQRKAGVDTSIAELMTVNLPSKIRMVEITGKKEDMQTASEGLNRISHEIQEASDAFTLQNSESSDDPSFRRITDIVSQAELMLDSGDIKGADSAYSQISQMYTALPAELKQKVFNKCLPLIDKLTLMRTAGLEPVAVKKRTGKKRGEA